jgi:hypothetical protein
MKFQILNNEQVGFYDEGGNLKATIQVSNNDLVIEPASSDGNIVFGENTIRDVEIGSISTPSNLTFLGGGTISSNGNTLYIGSSTLGDSIILSNVTIGSSVIWSTGLSGSFSGSHYGSFFGDGRGLVGITAIVEPAGPIGSVQFNDNINNSGSGDFIFDKTTGAVIITGSINITGSVSASTYYGDGSNLTGINSGFAGTASYALTASYVQNAQTASFVVSASYAQTASFVQNAQTASYVQNAQTASFVVSSSYAQTASYIQNAQTASYVLNAVSASYAATASYLSSLESELNNVLIFNLFIS